MSKAKPARREKKENRGRRVRKAPRVMQGPQAHAVPLAYTS